MSTVGLDLSKFEDREGHFWEMLRGRASRGPASELLGWRVLDIDPVEGTVKVEYQARPEFLNPMGMVHGGFIAAMLDDVMGPALIGMHPPGKANPTIEFKVSYHRPARPGKLIGIGRVLQKGSTVAFVEGKLYDEDEKLVASATGTFRIISLDLREEKRSKPEGMAKRQSLGTTGDSKPGIVTAANSTTSLPDGEGPFWDAIHGRRPLPPSADLLGWQVLDADTGSGCLRTRFTAQEQFLNPLGMVHGGFVAAMLDETMGPSLVCTLPGNHFCPTIELKVSFHRPVRPGPVFGVGQVLQKGGTIGFVEGKLYDAAETLLASATGTFRILAIERMKKDS